MRGHSATQRHVFFGIFILVSLTSGCTEEPITNVYITEPTDTFTVSGRVISYPGMEPISGATYTILTGNQTGTSDPNGYFEVANLSPGTYQVIVSAAEYTPSRVSMVLTAPRNKANINHQQDFFLLENSGELELTVRGQDLGEVLSGVTVEVVAAVFPSDIYGHQIDPASLTSTGQTDENGQVTLTGLPAASVWIAALAHDGDGDQVLDYGTQTSIFQLTDGEAAIGHLVMPIYSGDAPSIIATNLPQNYGSGVIAPTLFFIFSVPMQTIGSTVVSLNQTNYPYLDIPVTATWTSDIRLEVTPTEPLSEAGIGYDFSMTALSETELPFSLYRYSISWQTGTDPGGGSCEEVVTDLVANDPAFTEIDYDTGSIMLTWTAIPGSGGYRIYARDDRNNTQWVYLQDEPTDYEAGTITTVCSLPSSFDRYHVDGIQTPFAGTEVTFCVVPMYAVITTPGDPHGTVTVTDERAPDVAGIHQIGVGFNETDTTTKLRIVLNFTEYVDLTVAEPQIVFAEAGGDPGFVLDPSSGQWLELNGGHSGEFVFDISPGMDASEDLYQVTISELRDLAGNEMAAPYESEWTEVISAGALFDFEQSGQGWTREGQGWAWGTPVIGPGGGYNSARCWGVSLNAQYGNSWNTSLTSPEITIPVLNPVVSFWCWYNTESCCDSSRLLLLQGGSETQLDVFAGLSTGWVLETLDLSAYAGESVRFKFRFTSDGSVIRDGFFFDDFLVEQEVP